MFNLFLFECGAPWLDFTPMFRKWGGRVVRNNSESKKGPLGAHDGSGNAWLGLVVRLAVQALPGDGRGNPEENKGVKE